ncbi:MAG: hypothetical protein RIM99_03535 [Cyclobacteriaceae bacterium]
MANQDLFVLGWSLVMGMMILTLVIHLPLISFPRVKMSYAVFVILLLSISAVVYLLIHKYVGLSFRLVSLLDVYELRAEYKSVKNQLVTRILSWQGNIINPLLIVIGLINKKYWLVLLGLLGQLVLFSVTGFKSVFLSFIFISAVYFCIAWRPKHFGHIFIGGFIFVIVFASTIDLLFEINLATTFLVRRLVAMPGLLTAFYYDFFSSNEHIFLGHSILSPISKYPYDLSPPLLMGEVYWNDASTSANAHFFADAFANFGFIGIIYFAIILGGILWVFDSFAANRNIVIYGTIIAMPAFSLSNSALFVVLGTHGFGILMILMFLYPRKFDELA